MKKLYRELRSWLGPCWLVITGGEALLRKDATELAAYASSLGFEVEFLTNGYMLEEAAEGLAAAALGCVTISCDGSRRETLNMVRGREDFFERVMRGIESLVRCRRGRKNFHIRLKTVVMKTNLAELSEIAMLADDWGVEVFYQPIEQNYAQTYNADWYRRSALWVDDSKKAKEALEELVHLKQQGLPISNPESNFIIMKDYFSYPDRLMRIVRNHAPDRESDICLSGVGYCEILPDGKMKICGEGPAIGDCRDTHPREVWRRRPTCWRDGCMALDTDQAGI